MVACVGMHLHTISANNVNGIHAKPSEFLNPSSTTWRTVNAPLLTKLLDTVGGSPNVIWEVMNEPDEHHIGDSRSFHEAVVNAITGWHGRIGIDPLVSVNPLRPSTSLGNWATVKQ